MTCSHGHHVPGSVADTDAAYECVKAFEEPACVIVKHANPCGIATDKDILVAYEKAFASDPTSAFGGIIALNRELDKELAEKIINNQFVEVIISPGVTDEALNLTKAKENVRILNSKELGSQVKGFKFLSVTDGMLVQETDNGIVTKDDLKIVSKRVPSEIEIQNSFSSILATIGSLMMRPSLSQRHRYLHCDTSIFVRSLVIR